jgi:hypothetical protein
VANGNAIANIVLRNSSCGFYLIAYRSWQRRNEQIWCLFPKQDGVFLSQKEELRILAFFTVILMAQCISCPLLANSLPNCKQGWGRAEFAKNLCDLPFKKVLLNDTTVSQIHLFFSLDSPFYISD